MTAGNLWHQHPDHLPGTAFHAHPATPSITKNCPTSPCPALRTHCRISRPTWVMPGSPSAAMHSLTLSSQLYPPSRHSALPPARAIALRMPAAAASVSWQDLSCAWRGRRRQEVSDEVYMDVPVWHKSPSSPPYPHPTPPTHIMPWPLPPQPSHDYRDACALLVKARIRAAALPLPGLAPKQHLPTPRQSACAPPLPHASKSPPAATARASSHPPTLQLRWNSAHASACTVGAERSWGFSPSTAAAARRRAASLTASVPPLDALQVAVGRAHVVRKEATAAAR